MYSLQYQKVSRLGQGHDIQDLTFDYYFLLKYVYKN
jgi:hypothetical protein